MTVNGQKDEEDLCVIYKYRYCVIESIIYSVMFCKAVAAVWIISTYNKVGLFCLILTFKALIQIFFSVHDSMISLTVFSLPGVGIRLEEQLLQRRLKISPLCHQQLSVYNNAEVVQMMLPCL